MKTFTLLLTQLSLALAAPIEGRIALGKLPIPDDIDQAKLLSVGVLTVLDNGSEVSSASVRKDGTFSIPIALQTNSNFTIYVSHPMLRFTPVVVRKSGQSYEAISHSLIAGAGDVLPYPLVLTAAEFASPYVPEESVDVLQLLKNPMVIMGLVMLAMVSIMPKLQNSVSQQEMREMRQGLEEDGGMAANLLKKMIPADKPSASAGQGGGMNIPSLTDSDGNIRQRKK